MMSVITYGIWEWNHERVWPLLAEQMKDGSTNKHKNQNQISSTANFYYINRSRKVTTTIFIQLTKRKIKMHLSRQERLRELHQ